MARAKRVSANELARTAHLGIPMSRLPSWSRDLRIPGWDGHTLTNDERADRGFLLVYEVVRRTVTN